MTVTLPHGRTLVTADEAAAYAVALPAWVLGRATEARRPSFEAELR